MKKKTQPAEAPVVPKEIMELARKSVETDRPVPAKRCAVCGSAYTPTKGPRPSDELCWVCRRLKISAWRESEQQVVVQE